MCLEYNNNRYKYKEGTQKYGTRISLYFAIFFKSNVNSDH